MFSMHFAAAVGLDVQMDLAVERNLQAYHHAFLEDYRRKLRYERARMFFSKDFSYQKVRELDFELERVMIVLNELDIRRRKKT